MDDLKNFVGPDLFVGAFKAGRGLASRGLRNVADNRREAAGGNYTESVLAVERMSDILQTGLDRVSDQVTSLAERDLQTAKQLLYETVNVIMKHNETKYGVFKQFDERKIGLNTYYLSLEIPDNLRSRLEQTEMKSNDVYNDKRNNSSLLINVEALKISMFCTLLLFKNEPEMCLNFLSLKIKSIARDFGMSLTLKQVIWQNVPLLGDNKRNRTAVKQFYKDIRSGICSITSFWGEKYNCQCLCDALNEIKLKKRISSKRKLGLDGVILSGCFENRPILVAIGESVLYSKGSNELVSFNCPYSTVLMHTDTFDVEEIKKTKTKFDYRMKAKPAGNVPQVQATAAEAEISPVVGIFLKNCKIVADSKLVSEEKNGTTENGHKIVINENGVNISWLKNDKNQFENSFIPFAKFPQKFNENFKQMLDTEPDKPINEKLFFHTADSSKVRDTVQIIIEIAVTIDSQKIWRIYCHRKNGIVSTSKVHSDLQLPKCHALRWSSKLKEIEIVYINNEVRESLKLIFAQIQSNSNLFTGVSNKLSDGKVVDVLPGWLKDEAKYLYANRVVLAKDFVFVSLDVVTQ